MTMPAITHRIQAIHDRVCYHATDWRKDVKLIDDAGFRILSGPPVLRGPMVVSENPGLSKKIEKYDKDKFWLPSWPERLSYLDSVSLFAKRFLKICEVASIDPSRFNAAYTLVFRSKNRKQWTQQVPLDIRQRAECLSLKALMELISILKPPFIYAAGFRAFKVLGCSPEKEKYGRRKNNDIFCLLRYGRFEDIPVISSWHPSSRLTDENVSQIGKSLSQIKINDIKDNP